jgi:hypothetical protein
MNDIISEIEKDEDVRFETNNAITTLIGKVARVKTSGNKFTKHDNHIIGRYVLESNEPEEDQSFICNMLSSGMSPKDIFNMNKMFK